MTNTAAQVGSGTAGGSNVRVGPWPMGGFTVGATLGSGRGGGSGAGSGGGNVTMTEISREEVDVKIALSEAHTDTKFAELGTKFTEIRGDIALMNAAVARLATDVSENTKELRSDYKNTRLTIIVTAIASVLAIIGIILASQANEFHALSAGISIGEHAPVNPYPNAASGSQSQQDTGARKQPKNPPG